MGLQVSPIPARSLPMPCAEHPRRKPLDTARCRISSQAWSSGLGTRLTRKQLAEEAHLAPRPSPLAPCASPVTSIFEANLVQRPTGAPHIGAWPPQAYLVQAPDDLALHPSQCKGPDIYPQPSLLCDRYNFPNLPTSTATCFLTACLLYSHPFALSSARKRIRYPLVDCIEQFRPVGIARRFSLIWISRISSPPSPRHGIDLFAEGTRNKQLETRPGDGVTPRRFRAYRSDTNW